MWETISKTRARARKRTRQTTGIITVIPAAAACAAIGRVVGVTVHIIGNIFRRRQLAPITIAQHHFRPISVTPINPDHAHQIDGCSTKAVVALGPAAEAEGLRGLLIVVVVVQVSSVTLGTAQEGLLVI